MTENENEHCSIRLGGPRAFVEKMLAALTVATVVTVEEVPEKPAPPKIEPPPKPERKPTIHEFWVARSKWKSDGERPGRNWTGPCVLIFGYYHHFCQGRPEFTKDDLVYDFGECAITVASVDALAQCIVNMRSKKNELERGSRRGTYRLTKKGIAQVPQRMMGWEGDQK